jgi:2-oxoglutarate dehydrogenase E2 component (dihydrolipoamide succinyltransferase)
MIVEFKMPKMGESISEATIISWLKQVGDSVTAEEIILEVATDKVDSEVPSPCSGTITEIRFQKDDVVAVGEVLALISTDGAESTTTKSEVKEQVSNKEQAKMVESKSEAVNVKPPVLIKSNPDAFLSPLIISIAQKENLSLEEVQSIPGSGAAI